MNMPPLIQTLQSNQYENVPEDNLMSSFILGVLVVALTAGMGLFTINWIADYFYYRRCGGNRSLLPGLNCSPLLIYLQLYKTIYLGKGKKEHPMCLVLQFICGIFKIFEREGMVCISFLNRRAVFLYKPATVKDLLSSAETIEKPFFYKFLQPWQGTGLLLSNGDKWRSRRKLLTSSFHFRILGDFLPIIDEQSRVLVSKIKNQTEKTWLEVEPLITTCTLDIICETAMGVKVNAQSGEFKEYVNATHKIGEIIMDRLVKPWLWLDAVFFCLPVGKTFNANVQISHEHARKVVVERKEKSAMLENLSERTRLTSDINDSPSTRRRRMAFLDLLLEHHQVNANFTEEDILDEINSFMFGGHDTTASSITWTLYNLGLHSDIQDVALRELDSIFEDDPSRSITREDLGQMKYLECVIKETRRLYPPIPFLGRELKEDFNIQKYTIPAGSMCVICPLMLQRDSESFPNPEKFDPERFFPENFNGRHPYAYLPFSAGPRNCIGQKFAIMEEKAVLANILRDFRVESLDPRDKLKVMLGLIIHNVEPLRMRFTPRR